MSSTASTRPISTGCSRVPVVADVALQLQSNWMTDYRNSSGIVVEDGPLGPTIAIEDSSRVDPWIVRQAQTRGGLVYRAAGRVQPPRPTDVGRLIPEPRTRSRTRPPSVTTVRQPQEGPIHESPRIRHRERPRRQRLGARPPDRPERPLRRGRRRHDGLRAEPPPGRGRLELDQPAGRRDPARHRRPRGLQQAAVRVRDRAGHDDRPVRRQQQLVRRLGVLAAQAVRPPRRPHPQRRPQVLARQRPRPERRRAVLRPDRLPAPRARLQPARLPRRHPAAPRRPGAGARRRPLAGRVQRRDHRARRA